MRILLLSLLFAVAAPLGAQTLLTGPGDVPCPSANPTGLIRQAVCQTPRWCETSGKILPEWLKQPWLGGAAWDLRSGQLGWYSNGYLLYVAVPDPLGCNTCKIACVYDWNKNYGQKYGLITALAYLDIGAKAPFLFLATWHPTNGCFIVTTRIFSPCNISLAGACNFNWSKSIAIGGMTADPVTKRLLYTHCDWVNFSGNTLLIAPYDKPCTYDCKFPVPVQPCLGGPVTGAGFDSKTAMVYLTIGKVTQAFAWDRKCSFKVGPCCPATPTVYHGLTVIPGCPHGQPGTFKVSGNPSYTRSPDCQFRCSYCKSVPGYSGGLPQVGNLNFALTLTQTPISSAQRSAGAFLFLNGAGTWGPALIPTPCGQVTLYPAPIAPWFFSFGPFTPTGTTYCQGAVTLPLPIPCEASLVGAKLAGQWVVYTLEAAKPQLCLEFTPGFLMTM